MPKISQYANREDVLGEKHKAHLHSMLGRVFGDHEIIGITGVGKAIPVYRVVVSAGGKKETVYFKIQPKQPKDRIDAAYGKPVNPEVISNVIDDSIEAAKKRLKKLIEKGEIDEMDLKGEIGDWGVLNPFLAFSEDEDNWYYIQREVEPLPSRSPVLSSKVIRTIQSVMWDEIARRLRDSGIHMLDAQPNDRSIYNIPFDIERFRTDSEILTWMRGEKKKKEG